MINIKVTGIEVDAVVVAIAVWIIGPSGTAVVRGVIQNRLWAAGELVVRALGDTGNVGLVA